AYRNGLPENRRAKAVISQETYDQALRALEDSGYRNPDPKFKSW
ncbi:4025_t:CDS:1, partial [Paraglomus occultum]